MNCCTDPEPTWNFEKGYQHDTIGQPYITGECHNCKTKLKEVYTSSTVIEK